MNYCYFRWCRLLVKATVSAVMSLVYLATAAVFTWVLVYLHFWRINDDGDDEIERLEQIRDKQVDEKSKSLEEIHRLSRWGDWNRGSGQVGTVEIAGGGKRGSWQRGTRWQGWKSREWTTREWKTWYQVSRGKALEKALKLKFFSFT